MATIPPVALMLSLGGGLDREALPELCERARRALLARGAAGAVLLDVRRAPADAVTVDALARLRLTARRLGYHVRLAHASDELRSLIAFAGLADVLE